MSTTRTTGVSGNLVIICLTLVTLVMVAVLAVLIITGRDTNAWLTVLTPTLVVTIGVVSNTLKTSEVASDVQDVKHQTNGGTQALIETIQRQALLLAQSQPATGAHEQPPGDEAPPSPARPVG